MRDAHLSSLLRRTGRLVFLTEGTRGVALAAVVLIAAVVGALLLDAAAALSPTGLVALDVALLAVLVGALLFTIRHLRRHLLSRQRLARMIETRAGVPGNALINAIDLSERPPAGASASLVEAAVSRGDEAAGALVPRTAIDGRGLRRAMIGVLAALVGAVGLQLVLPGVYGAVSRRLLAPASDHPPFTLLAFDVAVEPEAIYFGRPATIRATVSGPGLPDHADLVFVDPDGDPDDVIPLLRAGALAAEEREFTLRIDRAIASRDFFVATDSGRSARYRLEVLPVPLIEGVDVAYAFPAYTHWPATGGPLTDEGIRSLSGTEVTVTARSNLPLAGGRLTLRTEAGENEVRLEPVSADARTVAGRFALDATGAFEIAVVGTDGTPSDASVEGRMVAAPDETPGVEIVQPAQHVVAPEGWAIDVAIRARDDIGVERITLHRAVNGWAPSPIDLEITGDRPTLAAAGSAFDLEALGAAGGDVITYYATAYDNHPGGEHFSQTPTFVIQVITEEEYIDLMRNQYRVDELAEELRAFEERLDELRAEREALLEELEPLREKAEAGEPLTEEERRRLAELEAALAQYAERASELAGEMARRAEDDPLYEFEAPYQEMLERLSEQLEQQAGAADAASAAMESARQAPDDASARRAMASALGAFRDQAEPFDAGSEGERRAAEEDVEDLRLADEMIAQAERVRGAILEQRDLADRLAEFRDREDLAPEEELRAHRLGEQQELLREELRDATERLEEAAEAARERLPRMSEAASKICASIGAMDVDADQARAAELARTGRGGEAFEAAEAAARNLERLLTECDGQQMQGQASDELDGCLGLPKPSLREGLRQLAGSRMIPGLGQTGEQGSGMQGSSARTMIVGPRRPSGRDSEATSGRLGRAVAGRDGGPGGANDGRAGPEALTPEAAGAFRGAAGRLDGVPLQFHEQAEAYFRRLADDSRPSAGREDR